MDPTRQELKLNQLYLLRHDNKLRRASLLAGASGKRVRLFHLIDTGARVELSADSPVYVLMPGYFRHPAYAIHCRLEFADTLERALSKDEKQKLTRQISMAQRVRVVDVVTRCDAEPYIIELLDEAGNIDFTLNTSVGRLFAKAYFEHESQELVKGGRIVSAHLENKLEF